MFGKNGKTISDEKFKLLLSNVLIERVHVTKFLGVHLDEDLNWKYHISQISLKVSRSLGILNKVRYIFSKSILRTLYFTIIQPYFIYCNIAWGGATQTALNKLFYLQKRAVRIVSHSKFRAPTNSIFKDLNILKLTDIHKMQMSLFVYKHLNALLPYCCVHHIQIATLSYPHSLCKKLLFKNTFCRTLVREKYIGITAAQIWDSLPDTLNHCLR